MKSFNVTMPEDLLQYVRHRTKDGGFGTPTEFLRHLIRKDRDEQAQRDLERRLLEGVRSGRSRTPVKTFFERMHATIEGVAPQRRKAKPNGRAKTTRSAARG